MTTAYGFKYMETNKKLFWVKGTVYVRECKSAWITTGTLILFLVQVPYPEYFILIFNKDYRNFTNLFQQSNGLWDPTTINQEESLFIKLCCSFTTKKKHHTVKKYTLQALLW